MTFATLCGGGGLFPLLHVRPSQGLAAEDLFEHAGHQAAYDKRRDDRVHDRVRVPWNNQSAVISQRKRPILNTFLKIRTLVLNLSRPI
jgi:hypothetical protein